jgi:hypothetical protein
MDVILDTNVLLGLLHADGASFTTSNRFADLITYLRRTASNLVLPVVVFEEFSRKYSDLIADSYKKSRDTWDSLHRNLVNPIAYPITGKGVKVIVFDDYACVPLQEVVFRGIHRIRPANAKGEELRDVVIWFMALEYAKAREIAFISGDGTFALEDKLHPDLEKDLSDRKVRISFHTSISHFIKENSLDNKEVGGPDLEPFIKEGELRGMIHEYLMGKMLRERQTISGVEIAAPQFRSGRKYQIASDSTYIEATFSAEAKVELQENPWTYFGQALPVDKFQYQSFSYEDADTALLQPRTTHPGLWNLNTPPMNVTFANYKVPKIVTTSEDVTFVADFTLRIVGGQRLSLELETVSV